MINRVLNNKLNTIPTPKRNLNFLGKFVQNLNFSNNLLQPSDTFKRNPESDELLKAVDTLVSKLNEQDVKIQKEDIMKVAKKLNYDPIEINLLTPVNGNKFYIARATGLSILMDCGAISKELLQEVCQGEDEKENFIIGYEQKFDELLEKSGLIDTNILQIKSFLDVAFDFNMMPCSSLYETIEKIYINNILQSVGVDEVLISFNNITINMAKKIAQEIANDDFLDTIKQSGMEHAAKITLYPVQNTQNFEIVKKATWKTQEGTEIYLTKTSSLDGKNIIERIENYSDGTSASWRIGKEGYFESRSYTKKIDLEDEEKSDANILLSQIEIIYDSNTKEPNAILLTKKSDILNGAYEKILYNLMDYPQDYDVLSAIKDDSIKGGKKLSEVTKNQDGTVEYKENINCNDCNIKRTYKKEVNGIDYSYSYQITDEKGFKILDTSISFTKDSNNQTTTIINGKKYIANFDDISRIITIKSENETQIIDFNIHANNDNNLWEYAKNLPVNLLKTLSTIYWIESQDNLSSFIIPTPKIEEKTPDSIKYSQLEPFNKSTYQIEQSFDDYESKFVFNIADNYPIEIPYDEETNSATFLDSRISFGDIGLDKLKQAPLYFLIALTTQLNDTDISNFAQQSIKSGISLLCSKNDKDVTAHELGHIQDFVILDNLNEDEDLIKIYNQEIDAFNSKYTQHSGLNHIEYFSQVGGSASTGLSELIAETNMLLTSFGCKLEEISTRSQFLVHNFPKTITYIASKLNLNSINH